MMFVHIRGKCLPDDGKWMDWSSREASLGLRQTRHVISVNELKVMHKIESRSATKGV